jgi:hypothetical protein
MKGLDWHALDLEFERTWQMSRDLTNGDVNDGDRLADFAPLADFLNRLMPAVMERG